MNTKIRFVGPFKDFKSLAFDDGCYLYAFTTGKRLKAGVTSQLKTRLAQHEGALRRYGRASIEELVVAGPYESRASERHLLTLCARSFPQSEDEWFESPATIDEVVPLFPA